ncbi:amino acid ABC transporter permease [Curvivirga aplysinae]|uniref:amino acid ABC transporter permease n=1 Tax=Curvivirga aplysinae TaxID=2529852 RepID=UPI0012BC96CF|nr:amino acid ABC transporter permease [Curvivirga aplysinae]MTI09601.1 amino acid ABC transporter permease [Curvivirga aplysinae]
MTTPNVADQPAKASMLYDPRVRSMAYQGLALIAIIWFGYFIWDNATTNMENRGIKTGFDFLWNRAGFDIIQTPVEYTQDSSYGRSFLVGLINTLIVAGLGVIVATILGFVIGVARLSNNYVIRKLATVYIEIFRNIPLLLQIFFWYHAVLKPLPSPRSLYEKGEVIAFGINNRGAYLPEPIFGDYSFLILLGLIAAFLGSYFLGKWAKKRQEMTGMPFPVFLCSFGMIIGLPFIGWLMAMVLASESAPLTFSYAEMAGFQLKGGLPIIPELVALLIALAVYTAAFIAEIVRAGIQSVSHGQTEAAHALGIRNGVTLRLVIIPQALRVIIPPLTSQYLNLTKNSSLATAIAYPDLVSVFAGTALNQTGQAVEIISLTMAVYLLVSLTTSVFMNWYNSKMSLVER